MKNLKKFRDPLPEKKANDLLDSLIVAIFQEFGQAKAAELWEKAKAIASKQ